MFRFAVWFPLLCILLAGCAGGSRTLGVPPIIKPDPLHRADPRLIQNPPADILAQFTIDTEGYIVDGPRTHPSEPVDHTLLITNAAVADSFAKVALGNGEENDSNFTPFGTEKRDNPWERKISKYDQDIGQQIYYRGGIISGRFYQTLDQSVKEISKNTGIDISFRPEKEPDSYFFYFFFEGLDDAREAASHFQALASESEPDTERHDSMLLVANIFDRIYRRGRESCYAYPTINGDDSRASTLIVFFLSLPGEILDTCAYEETIQAMGLFSDDNSLFNTKFTDAFKEYLVPTELDWMMLRILYDKRIKHGMTFEEVMPIVHKILSETRPHGDP